MKWKDYLVKAKTLFEEAERDLDISCFNKAVSAYWFAIEALMKSILLKHYKPIFEREGKLIAYFRRFISENNIHNTSIITDINAIYALRKIADHRSDLMTEAKAKFVADKAREVFHKLLSLLE